MSTRTTAQIFTTKEFLEGAGVRLHRGFSYIPENPFDPFLLFDDFSSDNPVDYLAGFPWHPHRGIETITYILKGEVQHGDSIGNEGVIGKGDIQWMTSGSGIIHQEMPRGSAGIIGFQLWLNMPKTQKMSKPRYQEYRAKDIPEFEYAKGAKMRIIAGSYGDVQGPIDHELTKPTYIDISLEPGVDITIPVESDQTVFYYVFEGELHDHGNIYKTGKVVLTNRKGTSLKLQAGSSGARLLLVSGKPLHEPVAWYGPVVMNTQSELALAFEELQAGTFIKS
jgi:quercetin 2,3-dioxygenase